MSTPIDAAKALSWDEAIWNLAGEKPGLVWMLD